MRLFAAAALFCLSPAVAFASTYAIPKDEPIATISIPDKWEPTAYDEGVEATSPDKKVYIAVESVEADDVKEAVKEGVEWFAKQGVEIDADSMKTSESHEGGASSFDVAFAGKDKSGPTAISMALVTTNMPKKILMVYFWGAPADAEANQGELKKIGDTLQLTK